MSPRKWTFRESMAPHSQSQFPSPSLFALSHPFRYQKENPQLVFNLELHSQVTMKTITPSPQDYKSRAQDLHEREVLHNAFYLFIATHPGPALLLLQSIHIGPRITMVTQQKRKDFEPAVKNEMKNNFVSFGDKVPCWSFVPLPSVLAIPVPPASDHTKKPLLLPFISNIVSKNSRIRCQRRH